jgi:hypothetical protein
MKTLHFHIYLVIMLALFAVNGKVQAQELDGELKTSLVKRIGNLLEERYVFPDVAKKCNDHITSRLASGAFDGIKDKEEFAAILTTELQSISKDKHMRVRLQKRSSEPVEQHNPFYEEFLFKNLNKKENAGFVKVEFLEGGIGYLDLRSFVPLAVAQNTAEAAMEFLSNADAVIVDLRENHGGSPDMISFICSYFFEEPTHLNSLYYREGDRTEEFYTRKIEGSTLTGVPLFVLTSSTTFSGGEEFANNIKTQKRGTLIGETTGGGANPGGTFRIDDDMIMFIPTGTAINPITNSNWEGTGVEPDIKVSAAKAYDLALEKALTAAEEYREAKMEIVQKQTEEIGRKLTEAEKLINEDENKAENIIKETLDEGLKSGVVDESSINMAGYDYLFKEKHQMAVALFKFNVSKFPASFNTYDSLGEAYMNSNKKELAISNYKKSLELNPDNRNAEEMIKKMSKEGE